ncbi:MAG: hypothetical protein A3C79_01365 [Candidatus Taylorbacteria bacterium RIFCSPHIGHO2_02_FULL_45_28]|uniref:RND efflux pump membrane fusion protein barrel-sandwich domain-containing protein n=1 Tax=Candidatus Taylorbacteria bacterium RIFCSPHIGHO2_12_FULL_45_16 TaxID=1802315 RepID=A0A1G2N183_9BACT|nr:MAG: hypothetical protein A2830_03530 [Candidatus Taylorbacteria bacterium RIFCSPHIGHO2_01_FULL_44_110]OHA25090.1 MAG: hypothetical protein A3C79_01365 [Candidatus Taylorbacteria bacterium RIFCSPHIGHO2_02_FULL_45_28]OHA28971.1 MAG: hypothetical protein A3F51_01750 [Candidatus Taylorbacteria bacterium RIFCSPHIGHO2_12_FULL_45_16]OHA33089.1 MAG: hypothetical protein A3A23_03430 [Candidatus Taylorbacteria bacterium RIFCSPLOWO2_01_FULL_45_59]OHA39422.1 MAG: hypothetical protein A3I98_02505 [Candi
MKLIKKHPILSGAILIVIIIILSLMILGGNGTKQETMTIRRSDFVSQISISGKVVATKNAELGLDQSGRISGIYAKVGDIVKTGTVIATIENNTFRADISQKQATLEKEYAKLVSLQKGTRSERLSIYRQEYADTSVALVIAMRNAYLQTESAFLSKVDLIYQNGNTVNPTIDVNPQSDTEKRQVEQDRLLVTEKLKLWRLSLNELSSTASSSQIKSTRLIGNETMELAKNLIDRLIIITGNLSVNNSGTSQSDIDADRSAINSAGQQVSTATASEQNAYAAWNSAYNTLILEESGSTSEDIAAQVAQVRSAEADLVSAQAQLKKTMIVAPFDGIITKIDLKVGEISSPSASQISLMSMGVFEVESYIPEINIARVKINDPAVITLDAYGANVSFKASVLTIDPAETMKDGVSTYKTRLRFTDNDPRIKSGMTANIVVITEKKSSVIIIPQSIITTENDKKFVRVKKGNIINSVEITTGSSTGLGQVEITSGLNEGDMVVLPPLSETI